MLALRAPMERRHPRGIAFRLEVQVMNHVFMNRIIWLRARVVAFIIGLSVCSGAAVAADKMSIRLNWIPGAEHGFLIHSQGERLVQRGRHRSRNRRRPRLDPCGQDSWQW